MQQVCTFSKTHGDNKEHGIASPQNKAAVCVISLKLQSMIEMIPLDRDVPKLLSMVGIQLAAVPISEHTLPAARQSLSNYFIAIFKRIAVTGEERKKKDRDAFEVEAVVGPSNPFDRGRPSPLQWHLMLER